MILGAVVAVGGCTAPTPRPPPAPPRADTSPPLDEVQWIGTHNSYHVAPATGLYTLVDDRAVAWGYTHPPIPAQLDAGIRAIELDVYVDDDARFAEPVGPIPPATRAAFAQPGLKVFHVPDLDQGSNCPTWRGCLADIAAWSAAHPGHFPILVQVECVARGVGDRGPFDFVEAAAWEAPHVEELDGSLWEILGPERLVTPDLIRGTREAVGAALRDEGWPRVDALRGKVLVFVAEDRSIARAQLDRHPALRGSAFFLELPAGDPDGSILVLNNPARDAPRIDAARADHLLVRTRADAELEEVRAGDRARMDAAFRGGANVISTDAPAALEPRRAGYAVSFPGLPAGATVRVHPQSARHDAGAAIAP